MTPATHHRLAALRTPAPAPRLRLRDLALLLTIAAATATLGHAALQTALALPHLAATTIAERAMP